MGQTTAAWPRMIKEEPSPLPQLRAAAAAHGTPAPAAQLSMLDLWSKRSLGHLTEQGEPFVGTVEPHGVLYMKLTPDAANV